MITEGSTAIRARARRRAGSARPSREASEEAVGRPTSRQTRRDDVDEERRPIPTSTCCGGVWRGWPSRCCGRSWRSPLLSYSAPTPRDDGVPAQPAPANLCAARPAMRGTTRTNCGATAHPGCWRSRRCGWAEQARAAREPGAGSDPRRDHDGGRVSGFQAAAPALDRSGPTRRAVWWERSAVGAHRVVLTAGTFLILLLMLCVGAIVALDVWAVLAAIWTGRALYASAKTSGRVAVAAAQAGGASVRRSSQARAARRQETDAYGYRPDDVSDDRQLPELADSRTSRAAWAAPGPCVPVARSARPRRARSTDDLSLFDPAGGGGAPVCQPKMPVAAPLRPSSTIRTRRTPASVPERPRPLSPRVQPDELTPRSRNCRCGSRPTSRSATDEDLRGAGQRPTTAGMNIEATGSRPRPA